MRLLSWTNIDRVALFWRGWLWLATVGLLGVGLIWGGWFAPVDRLQGEVMRIIYVHVPMAYVATLGYGVMALTALLVVVWRLPLAGLIHRSLAPVVLTAAVITLATGMIWAKPTWGVWWVWEARLTSMFVLALTVLGVFVLLEGRGGSRSVLGPSFSAALLTLVGGVNLPIVKFSVDWWATVHQGASLLRSGGASIDPSILWPLGLTMLGCACGSVLLVAYRVQTQRQQIRVQRRLLQLAPSRVTVVSSSSSSPLTMEPDGPQQASRFSIP